MNQLGLSLPNTAIIGLCDNMSKGDLYEKIYI